MLITFLHQSLFNKPAKPTTTQRPILKLPGFQVGDPRNKAKTRSAEEAPDRSESFPILLQLQSQTPTYLFATCS